MSISDDDQIWSQLSSADVDIYVDMSHIYGSTSQQISGLGIAGPSTILEQVMMSKQVLKLTVLVMIIILLFTMMEITKILLIHPNKLIPVHRGNGD